MTAGTNVRHGIAQAANGRWWVVREIDGTQYRIAGPVRRRKAEQLARMAADDLRSSLAAAGVPLESVPTLPDEPQVGGAS